MRLSHVSVLGRKIQHPVGSIGQKVSRRTRRKQEQMPVGSVYLYVSKQCPRQRLSSMNNSRLYKKKQSYCLKYDYNHYF